MEITSRAHTRVNHVMLRVTDEEVRKLVRESRNHTGDDAQAIRELVAMIETHTTAITAEKSV